MSHRLPKHSPSTKEAFGFETRFLHDSGQYGELETGATVLAFASHAMGEMNFDGKYQGAD